MDVQESLPAVIADPGLLERVVANVDRECREIRPARRSGHRRSECASPIGWKLRVDRSRPRGAGRREVDDLRTFSTTRRCPRGRGLGLGLAVARGFTEAMNGSLTRRGHAGWWAHDGHRAAERCGHCHPVVVEALNPHGSRMTRVLVVDDEPQLVRALVINLRARSYVVDAAPTAARPWTSRHRDTPTWSSSTSACPTWTASTSCADCAVGQPCRSSCSRPGKDRRRRSRRSTPAPTTT